MYIKQITIDGFKSYKDHTIIDTFSPMHNVVVGRNGSGKSNFFWALRFVLCDAYSTLSAQERQTLLHDGGAYQTNTAYVEIIFDNSDQRFPTSKEDVVLRRTIGINKDEHTFNGKLFTKGKIIDFLESAGFSRHNPYYIVPQGRVTSLTNARDSDRLNLFKEIAGTSVYEERKSESIKIMEETNLKKQRVEYSLSQINERLKELEAEKDHLREYQDLDLQRRTIQYVIYWREIEEINESMAGIDEIRKSGADDILTLSTRLEKLQNDINSDNARLQYLKDKIAILNAEKEEHSGNVEKCLKYKAGLEMNLSRIKDKSAIEEGSCNTTQKKQKDLEIDIARKEKELAKCIENLESARNLEFSFDENLQRMKQEYEMALAARNASKLFKSKEDYYKHLNMEAEASKSLVDIYSSKVVSLESKIKSYTYNSDDLVSKIDTLKMRVDSTKSNFLKIESERSTKREELSLLNENARDLWRRENVVNLKLQSILKDIESGRRALYSLLDRETSEGLESLQCILKEDSIDGCYGTLFGLFDVDSVYDTVVSTAAGKRLFNVIVESSSVAFEIISKLNKKYSGRLTFIPLQNIETHSATFKDTDEAISLVRKLNFDPKYENAFNQVFGKFIVCQTLELASKYSKMPNVSCALTLDGDRVDSNGYVSGGYKESNRSMMSSVRSLKLSEERRIKAEKELESISLESLNLEQRIISLRNEILHLDNEHKTISVLSKNQLTELRKLQDEHRSISALISSETSVCEAAKLKHRRAESKLRALTSEGGAHSLKNLEHDSDALHSELQKLSKEVDMATKRRSELESLKSSIEFELSENLYRQRDDIKLAVYDISGGPTADEALSLSRRYSSAGGGLFEAEEKLKKVLKELDSTKNELSQKISNVELSKQDHNHVTKELDKLRFAMEKCMLKRSNIHKVKQDVAARIRGLGILPSDTFETYQSKSEPVLMEMLQNINSKLKDYVHANKNAFEQYHAFTRQFEQLNQRKEDLDKSAVAIKDLVVNLDSRKGEAIARSLRQVCKCFHEVWQKLVPSGSGKLIPLRGIGVNSASQDFDEEASMSSSCLQSQYKHSNSPSGGMVGSVSRGSNGREDAPGSSIDAYTGVSIQVSFNSPDGECLRLQQLSGGQKSLVALALIFAIQKCDPAPFYLFDEIDAALDPQYRVCVASMIHELSRNAQFITTTFHGELLENADRCYGVKFSNKVSDIKAISHEEAKQFIEEAGPIAA